MAGCYICLVIRSCERARARANAFFASKHPRDLPYAWLERASARCRVVYRRLPAIEAAEWIPHPASDAALAMTSIPLSKTAGFRSLDIQKRIRSIS